ncbi:hypothetical protein OUZ56_024376 [Daphnia magna]|uniref:Uncharacterized protein n=1 Tax=Daphnia magna TaxID=35525 RepID=A0ABR0B0N8_9CRUS|nr:hypothetical protein OUZ56_024376 [Daphnia magna]
MPSNELPRLKTFTPEEVLPHPRVAQTEPRVPRNTNRGLYCKDYSNDNSTYPIRISAPTVQVAFIGFSYGEGDEQ